MFGALELTADRSLPLPPLRAERYKIEHAQGRTPRRLERPIRSENANRAAILRAQRSATCDRISTIRLEAIRHGEFCFIGLDIPGISAALLFHEYNSGISSSNINASSRLDRTSANNFPEFRGRRSFAVVSPLNTNIGRTAAHQPSAPRSLRPARSEGEGSNDDDSEIFMGCGELPAPEEKRREERRGQHRAVE